MRIGQRRLRFHSSWSGYQRSWVRDDIFAGVAVTALMIPHGMAYAELAGLPAVTGLYTTITSLLVYAAVGPSRTLLVGPDSSLAPLIAAALATVGANTPAEAVANAGVLALIAGVLGLLAGASRIGSAAELLARPVQVGFLNGLAIAMIVSQAPRLAGMSAEGETPLTQAIDVIREIAAGEVVPLTLALGSLALVLMMVVARIGRRVPAVLVGVVATMVLVWAFSLSDHDVSVVGALPSGFPTPALPTAELGDWPELVLAAAGIAWVTLTDTTVLSRSFAGRTGQRVDPNREVAAMGAVNVVSGLMQGFPVSASTTRTATSRAAGGHSQLVGVVSAALVVVVIAAAGGITEYLPETALAAVVIAAAIALFDAATPIWLFEVRRSEFVLCVVATAGVVVLGVLYGLLFAIVLSLANFVRRMWRPHDAVLGLVAGRSGLHDVGRHPGAHQWAGLVVLRFDAPLFFANADHFERRVDQIIRSADRPRRLVVAAEAISDIDTSAAAMLDRLITRLGEQGVDLHFAGLKGPVKDRLRRYGVYERLGDEGFHSTIESAVGVYLGDRAAGRR